MALIGFTRYRKRIALRSMVACVNAKPRLFAMSCVVPIALSNVYHTSRACGAIMYSSHLVTLRSSHVYHLLGSMGM